VHISIASDPLHAKLRLINLFVVRSDDGIILDRRSQLEGVVRATRNDRVAIVRTLRWSRREIACCDRIKFEITLDTSSNGVLGIDDVRARPKKDKDAEGGKRDTCCCSQQSKSASPLIAPMGSMRCGRH
jgi:hypothetical protein